MPSSQAKTASPPIPESLCLLQPSFRTPVRFVQSTQGALISAFHILFMVLLSLLLRPSPLVANND